jgi:peptidoglycan/LPS O-acetylase OafA/YrhL
MEPVHWLLKPLYEEGWAAVDLFFPLSGFVFYWLYGRAIADRSIGLPGFAVLRASRLWPLHTLMLFVAACLQYAFHIRTGHWFIYSANDWQHFVSSLVMAQQWLPPTLAQSFDGPAWSVSVEVLLYGSFFVVVRAGFGGWRAALLIAMASVALIFWNEFIARGLMGFFMGGVVFHASERIKLSSNARFIAQAAGLVAIGVWFLIFYEIFAAPLHAALGWVAGNVPHDWRYDLWVGWLFRLLFTFVAAPLTILALALDEQLLVGRYRGVSWLGDISYSTYMIHVPMQMCLALVALSFGLEPEEFMSPWVLIAFLGVLIGLGYLSFRYFERPTQRWLRGSNLATLTPAPSPS